MKPHITDSEVSAEYASKDAWGLHSGIDIHGCDPKLIRSASAIRKFVNELCKEIEMKKFGPCTVVNFGEDARVAGYSMTQLIETSLISGHFANESNTAYIDVFSCKVYNPQTVARFATKFFKGKDYTLHYTFRK